MRSVTLRIVGCGTVVPPVRSGRVHRGSTERVNREVELEEVTLRVFLVLTVLVLLAMVWPSVALAGCEKDTDCKGDRICENEKCVSPAQAAPSPSSPSAKDVQRLEDLLNKTQCGGSFKVAQVKDYGVRCRHVVLGWYTFCPEVRHWTSEESWCGGATYLLLKDMTHWSEMSYVGVIKGDPVDGYCVTVAKERCLAITKSETISKEIADLAMRISGLPPHRR